MTLRNDTGFKKKVVQQKTQEIISLSPRVRPVHQGVCSGLQEDSLSRHDGGQMAQSPTGVCALPFHRWTFCLHRPQIHLSHAKSF